MWFAEICAGKIGKIVPAPSEAEAQSAQPGTTIDYNVPVSGTGAPHEMSKAELENWGQTDDPTEATAIFPPDEPMGWPAKDYTRATIAYLDEFGHTVNVATPDGAISTTEYNATGDVSRTLTPDNRAAALKEGSKSGEVSKLLDTENTYNKEGTELEKTLGPQHTVKLSSGSQVLARGETQYSYDEGAPSEGGPYLLATKMTESALVSGKEEETRTSTSAYSGQENLGWQLGKPTSVTTDPSGLKLTHTIEYETGTGEVSETRMPASSGANSAHDTQTIYYTAAANSTYPGCGEHAEWAEPAMPDPAPKQPETSGLPNLPVTTATYNIWDEPVKTTETVGSTTRTKTATYERLRAPGKRPQSARRSAPRCRPLPTNTTKKPERLKNRARRAKAKPKQSQASTTRSDSSISYTDADEATTTYEYDIDGRIKKINDGKGTETYTYNATTGFLTELLNEYGTTKLAFAASYDTEGKLLTEGYPNGMNADYTYNATGEPTSLEYIKTTHCTEKCTWFSDTVVPSIHGQWLEQTSTLSHQAYTYDAAGRLTQVQNTPVGGKCTTRIYAYEEDTNRTSLTTREPNSKGECAAEGGTVEKHSYDTADRLTDTGIKYSEFGNITSLPSSDAGGHRTHKHLLHRQPARESDTKRRDDRLHPRPRRAHPRNRLHREKSLRHHQPLRRPRQLPRVDHEHLQRMDTQHPRDQLVALRPSRTTAKHQCCSSPTSTATSSPRHPSAKPKRNCSPPAKPASSACRPPAPQPNTPGSGPNSSPTELPSGEIAMGARSYIPQLGRFLQPDPRPGGSANAYSYTFGDPVNTSDPSGEFTVAIPTWFIELNDRRSPTSNRSGRSRNPQSRRRSRRQSSSRSRRQGSGSRRRNGRPPVRGPGRTTRRLCRLGLRIRRSNGPRRRRMRRRSRRPALHHRQGRPGSFLWQELNRT